jgi:hypothetical protein
MEGQDIRGLIEAYSQVYEAPEVLNEEVEQIDEMGQPGARPTGQNSSVVRTTPGAGSAGGSGSGGRRGSGVRYSTSAVTANPPSRKPSPTFQNSGGFGRYGAPSTQVKTPTEKPAPTKPGSNTPASTRPSATPAGQTNTKKPTAPTAPQKPAGSAMDQWRAANPKLAAAADEKARIRGTSQTDNPLMKDMRSKMSMTPSVQSPTLAKDLGKGGGNQSLLNNPNASKAAPPKPAATATPKPTAVAKPSGFDLAKKGVNLAAGVDIFDLVKGHLLDEGYAETEENALVIMTNMSEEWRKSILEAHGIEILDEAQEARENPEKHEEEKEKEDEKKYGKVRGERTPMPPRGDKRREDFEKWYAKHVR